MKTAEEWVERYKDDTDGDCTRSEAVDYIRSLVLEIQADAFHAGKLEGLNDARKIISKFDLIDESFQIKNASDSIK